MSWYTGVLLGAKRFMASWHKGQKETIRLREVNRAAKVLLANQKTKRGKAEEDRGAGREGESVERVLVVIASEQPVHCLFVWFFLCLPFPFFIFYFAALIYLHLGLVYS